jgi:hypothetical protein
MSRFNDTWARGMRRVAILAGIVGLAAGGSLAWHQPQELPQVRARHDRFQALVASPATASIRKTADAVQQELSSGPGDRLDQVFRSVDKAEAGGMDLNFDQGENNGWSVPLLNQFEQHLHATSGAHVVPDQNDVKAIVDPAGKIITIRLRPEEVISGGPVPGWSKYAGAMVFAPLGFPIPWGFVRLIAWTVAGFPRPAGIGDPQ